MERGEGSIQQKQNVNCTMRHKFYDSKVEEKRRENSVKLWRIKDKAKYAGRRLLLYIWKAVKIAAFRAFRLILARVA